MTRSRSNGASCLHTLFSVALLVVVSVARALVLENLSPIESALLRTRLLGIETAIQSKYRPHLVIRSDTTATSSTSTTLIFPGAGGVDPLVEELSSVLPHSHIVDWSEHRGSLLTAAYDGEAVGQGIANLLLSLQSNNHNNNNNGDNKSENRVLHFIGISVGAFAANAAATVMYQQQQQQGGPSATQVKLTLLDPFCGRGIFGSSYGKNHFGKYATQSIQILNTDDPVPTTNDPLPYCYCLDVTRAPERRTFTPLPGDTMHSWPLAYMARHYQEPNSDSVIPGTVVTIT